MRNTQCLDLTSERNPTARMTQLKTLCLKPLHATVHFIGVERNILMLPSSSNKVHAVVAL